MRSLPRPSITTLLQKSVRLSWSFGLFGRSGRSPSCVWLNETNQTNQIDQRNQMSRPRWLFEAIDEIARSSGQIGGDLLGVAGGNIFLQSLKKSEDLHTGRHLAYP